MHTFFKKFWKKKQDDDGHSNPHVSLFECAALSLDVYKDKARPPYWQKFKSFHTIDGYYGALYFKAIPRNNNPKYNDYHLVIAHRGTDNWADIILENTGIPSGAVSTKFPKIFNLVCEAVKQFYEQYDSYASLINTGHSLG